MQSDGPYGHLEKGPGYCEYECLACAYDKGRKAAEKDFKELLEITQWLDDDSGYESAGTKSFRAWKKARGIE